MEEIKRVILEIKNSKKLVTELRENGRKLFEEVYNWEKQEEKLIKLYEELMLRRENK